MNRTMTRRQAALLLSQAIATAPALGWANRLAGQTDMPVHAGQATATAGAPVYVVLWFDTEDYILPASDDAAKRIADFLTAQGVRATFKVVGEKARVLEARHRTDVIAALNRHEIGYHSNTHSQQPTIAEYESVLDWEQGAEEFDRREHGGFEDVKRIFGKAPTCFGQPGVSWAPQAYPALKKWGVHVYLDDGPQVQLDGKPFWYGGLLNIFGIGAGQQLEPNEDWSNLEAAKDYFNSLHAQLSAQPVGGLVSFMFHPTQFISEVFWDAVNFAKGANPPRSEWKIQPQRSTADREHAFGYFEALVRHLRSFPNVRFITASEALALYCDRARSRRFETKELKRIAAEVSPLVGFQVTGEYEISASEVFVLLNSAVADVVRSGSFGAAVLGDTPYGPASAATDAATNELSEVSWSQFARTALDVQAILGRTGQIPNTVWMGSHAVTPESYLLALASVAQQILNGQAPPETVKILPAELAVGRYVAKDSVAIWNWPIFPPGFHSLHLMELARLQAWTLKPALLPIAR